MGGSGGPGARLRVAALLVLAVRSGGDAPTQLFPLLEAGALPPALEPTHLAALPSSGTRASFCGRPGAVVAVGRQLGANVSTLVVLDGPSPHPILNATLSGAGAAGWGVTTTAGFVADGRAAVAMAGGHAASGAVGVWLVSPADDCSGFSLASPVLTIGAASNASVAALASLDSKDGPVLLALMTSGHLHALGVRAGKLADLGWQLPPLASPEGSARWAALAAASPSGSQHDMIAVTACGGTHLLRITPPAAAGGAAAVADVVSQAMGQDVPKCDVIGAAIADVDGDGVPEAAIASARGRIAVIDLTPTANGTLQLVQISDNEAQPERATTTDAQAPRPWVAFATAPIVSAATKGTGADWQLVALRAHEALAVPGKECAKCPVSDQNACWSHHSGLGSSHRERCDTG